ncbi:DUF1963 domain-containing protein [Streptomyces sp. NPDC090306]|uniref:DUF1963 domain-containing protein n=1 Tax=Streptomyces sp. NPDC090306 TaxID=3365961 RepID=UPI00382B5F35
MARTTPPRPLDVRTLFPGVVTYQKTAVRLHPRLGHPSARESSLGGPVLWPLSEPWPHCEDNHPRTAFSPPAQGPIPLVPVLQLFATDVPNLAFPDTADLLQVLWCPFDHEDGYVPRPERYWRGSSLSDLQSASPPSPVGPADDYLPTACVLHPERVTDYPNWDLPEEVADALEVRFEQVEEETGWSYWSHLSVSNGVKVGGYPTWTQEPNWPTCPTCSARMEHLLTINSSEFDGKGWRTWLPVEDTPATRTIWDLPYKQRTEIQRPLGSCSATWAAPTCSNAPAAPTGPSPTVQTVLDRARLQSKGHTGADEAAVDHFGTVLQHLELAFHGWGDLAEVGGGEVADVSLDQRSNALLRLRSGA